jgi:hypothetical protein
VHEACDLPPSETLFKNAILRVVSIAEDLPGKGPTQRLKLPQPSRVLKPQQLPLGRFKSESATPNNWLTTLCPWKSYINPEGLRAFGLRSNRANVSE